MKLYIIDDDIAVIRMIEEIILDSNLGEIVGMSTNSVHAMEEVTLLKPDLILIDLLMPELDGISFVEKISKINPKVKCVMISQVSSKKIVGDAYEKGITFFIGKPVNKKELTHVILNIRHQIQMEHNLENIRDLLNHTGSSLVNMHHEKVGDERKYKLIFSKLGILGEAGCDDIIKICEFYRTNRNVLQLKLMDITNELTDNPKAMEQRMRRTINKGMSNVASLGVEDYLNETFVKYSNTLFDFDQVRMEMEFARGKSKTGGKINIKKFIDNLLLIVEEM